MEQNTLETTLQKFTDTLQQIATALFNPKSKLFVTVEEAAEMLSLCKKTVREMCKDEIFHPLKIGTSNKWVIPVAELTDYADRKRRGEKDKYLSKKEKKQILLKEFAKNKGMCRRAVRVDALKIRLSQDAQCENKTK